MTAINQLITEDPQGWTIYYFPKTLQNIEHKVKTSYGISKGKYRYTGNSPIIGPGQGSKGAMGAYTTVTTSLLRTMDKLAYGVTNESPDRDIKYHKKSQMHVYDNTTYVNNFQKWITNPPTNETIKEYLTHDAQTWERCLWTSGVLLKLPKVLILHYEMGI